MSDRVNAYSWPGFPVRPLTLLPKSDEDFPRLGKRTTNCLPPAVSTEKTHWSIQAYVALGRPRPVQSGSDTIFKIRTCCFSGNLTVAVSSLRHIHPLRTTTLTIHLGDLPKMRQSSPSLVSESGVHRKPRLNHAFVFLYGWTTFVA